MVAEDKTSAVVLTLVDRYRSVVEENLCWAEVVEDKTEDGHGCGKWTDVG